ncbi:MAG: general secretion pathway protein GspK [Opitutaceae bacterium]|nr:general secretion pathway protein GspK [Opitutaceae bacterium]
MRRFDRPKRFVRAIRADKPSGAAAPQSKIENRKSKIPRASRASILVLVLITLVVVGLAMTLFIEKASNDLLVEVRANDAAHLRLEAYSALETTLAVMEDFRATIGTLHSPSEGWGDPLAFAAYEPVEGRSVEVTFVDESGKLSLPNVEPTTLVNLFKSWELAQNDAEKLSDALLGWMRPDFIPSAAGAPQPEDYERDEIPFAPPGRSFQSLDELASIDYAREVFYDEHGNRNELWHRFAAMFSLYSYDAPNLNAAPPDLLAALGDLDTTRQQQRSLDDFLSGADSRAGGAPGYFANTDEIGILLGANSLAMSMGVEIKALRVIVTVREGESVYRLNVLIAPPKGAKPPESWTTAAETAAASASAKTAAPGGAQAPAAPNTATARSASGAAKAGTSAAASAATATDLNYPYVFLEIRENDVIPSASAIDNAAEDDTLLAPRIQ